MIYIRSNRCRIGSVVYKFTGLMYGRMDMFKFSSGITSNYSKEFVSHYFIKLKER